LQVRLPIHGGLTPAAPVERAFVHRKRRYFRGQRTPCTAPRAGGVSPRGFIPQVSVKRGKSSRGSRRRGSENDGGLTPAALVNVRSSTANVAFFGGPASRTKSGWRKPAVGYHPIVRGERNHSTKTDRHCRCGYRPTVGSHLPLLTGCAFVHRKRRFSTGERSCSNQERGT
jgi:hypothetical protein